MRDCAEPCSIGKLNRLNATLILHTDTFPHCPGGLSHVDAVSLGGLAIPNP